MEKQRRLPRRELPNIRAQFVRMLDAELPAKSIMTALKLSRSTFFEWKRLYRERGVKGLEVRPIPGGTPKLTDQQTNQLLRWIIGRHPGRGRPVRPLAGAAAFDFRCEAAVFRRSPSVPLPLRNGSGSCY